MSGWLTTTAIVCSPSTPRDKARMIFSSVFWAGRCFTFIGHITWIRWRTGHGKIHGEEQPSCWSHRDFQYLKSGSHISTQPIFSSERQKWTKPALPPKRYLYTDPGQPQPPPPLLRTPALSCFLTASSSENFASEYNCTSNSHQPHNKHETFVFIQHYLNVLWKFFSKKNKSQPISTPRETSPASVRLFHSRI